MSGCTVKLVMLGNSGVGKTSIVRRFVYNEHDAYAATLGATFCSKIVNIPSSTDFIKFQIWDTAGQEMYRGLASLYYKDAAAAILAYDITNKDSFEGLKEWVNELRENEAANIILAIAGNKSDLLSEEKIDVSSVKAYADSIGAIFKYTSAKEDEGVNDIFIEIARELHPHLKEKFPDHQEEEGGIQEDKPVNPFKEPRQSCFLQAKKHEKQARNKKGGCCSQQLGF
eukprot:TRINITY_DN532_c0_g1_i1.p1 TRINITY_DN532_c0_g1~~TRINITY_DN532_c0_g1_i1.p1  ORF type:complete len:227 (+),score=25.95 TRINITY_DN532_c0_g1_i1:39-719(+)